jgi:hypothetical protein
MLRIAPEMTVLKTMFCWLHFKVDSKEGAESPANFCLDQG